MLVDFKCSSFFGKGEGVEGLKACLAAPSRQVFLLKVES